MVVVVVVVVQHKALSSQLRCDSYARGYDGIVAMPQLLFLSRLMRM